MSKNVKIYYKVHNIQNIIPDVSDCDRSHLPVFYGKECDIYTSGLSWDPHPSNPVLKTNGEIYTFIDPAAVVSSAPEQSEIGLLPSFNASYAVISASTSDTVASLVTKVGFTPDTTLDMIAHGFNPEAVSVFPLPNGGKVGLHYVHIKLNSGQDFVYGHYEQLGDPTEPQKFNIITAISQIRAYAESVKAPFIFIVNSAYPISSLIPTIVGSFPLSFGVYPRNRMITNCLLTDSTTLAIQNKYLVVANGIDVDIEIIPPLNSVKYNKQEQNAIIVTLKNLKIGEGTTSNATAVKNFLLQPRNMILQEF